MSQSSPEVFPLALLASAAAWTAQPAAGDAGLSVLGRCPGCPGTHPVPGWIPGAAAAQGRQGLPAEPAQGQGRGWGQDWDRDRMGMGTFRASFLP